VAFVAASSSSLDGSRAHRKEAIVKSQNAPEKLDASRAGPEVAEFFSTYFVAKSTRDLEGMMNHFSPDVATYSDAVMGWAVDGYEAIRAGYTMRMQQPEDALSYPTAILGDLSNGTGSVLVAFTNTPEVVGDELHILAPIDLRDGKIVRQVDYWDSRAFDDGIYHAQRHPADDFPRAYKEDVVGTHAAPIIVDVATRLLAAIAAGDAKEAASLFDYDAVLDDVALRVHVTGRSAIERYFGRTLDTAPLGVGSRLRHVVGGTLGGGVEWHCRPGLGAVDGVMALALDSDGQIARATNVYDSRQLEDEMRSTLIELSTRP
jgi:ketosteroid isomerase-like protein